jgi:hypothetical protein
MKKFIIGLDVSTSVTGVCVLSQDEENPNNSKIVFLDRIEFKPSDSLWEKADKAFHFFKEIKEKHGSEIIWKLALEEPLLGFQKGMSSAKTITTLMRFNGIISYIGRSIFHIDPLYISSSHARKLCGIKMQKNSVAGMSGKEQVFKFMSENDLKDIDWPKKKNGKIADWSRDATDAYVIAKASFLEKDN